MEDKEFNIRGVAHDCDVAKVAVLGVPNNPGIAHSIFAALAEANVDVDMIVQSVQRSNDDLTDIIFTITDTDLEDARRVLGELQSQEKLTTIIYDDNMAKVSIVGAGMLGTPGVAARMFGALGRVGVNILIVSTSEISVSCLINRDDVAKAIQAIHKEFWGNKTA